MGEVSYEIVNPAWHPHGDMVDSPIELYKGVCAQVSRCHGFYFPRC